MTPIQRYLDPELLRRLSSLTVEARTVAAGTTVGRHASPVRGSSIEFRQHRFYAPGDEPRRIDWRVLARTDRPYVREYEQETNLRCLIMLDASGSMAYGSGAANKMTYARRVAAALAYVMLSQGEAVGVATFGGTTQYVPPHGGRAQLTRVIDALDRTAAGGHANAAAACAAVANRLHRRSFVVLLSDCLAEPAAIARGLGRLRHDRHEAAVARVLHRDEVEFPFSRWCRFVGSEGEGTRTVEPAEARQAYLGRYEAHRRALADACMALGVRVHEWQTDADVGHAVSRFVLGATEAVPRRGGRGR